MWNLIMSPEISLSLNKTFAIFEELPYDGDTMLDTLHYDGY